MAKKSREREKKYIKQHYKFLFSAATMANVGNNDEVKKREKKRFILRTYSFFLRKTFYDDGGKLMWDTMKSIKEEG